MKKRLISGIKPTGKIHIGNYLGSIKKWLELQEEYESFFFIADYHALTTEKDKKELKKQVKELLIDLISLGLNPQKTTIFKQSDIRGHTELAWIFNCLIPVSELERMTQYKNMKIKEKSINAGLLTYPTLQAADILLYKGEYVPVGEDQLQHLELTRILARKFNNNYLTYFKEIKPILSPAPRIMSLNNPRKKMSKSLGEASYIAIRDDAETIARKIRKAISNKEGVNNLIELYEYFGNKDKLNKFKKDYRNNSLMNSELKQELTTAIINFLKPIQKNILYYEKHYNKIEKIIKKGNKKVQKIANNNLEEIKNIIGLK